MSVAHGSSLTSSTDPTEAVSSSVARSSSFGEGRRKASLSAQSDSLLPDLPCHAHVVSTEHVQHGVLGISAAQHLLGNDRDALRFHESDLARVALVCGEEVGPRAQVLLQLGAVEDVVESKSNMLW